MNLVKITGSLGYFLRSLKIFSLTLSGENVNSNGEQSSRRQERLPVKEHKLLESVLTTARNSPDR